MNAETRAKELFPLAFGETLSPEQAAFRDRIATAIRSAENDKLEEAAAHFERYSAAFSGRSFAATLRSLKSKD